MGAYTCLKPAKYAGVNYSPGDIIPEEAIPANRVNAMKRLGLIADTQEIILQPAEPMEITIPIPIQMEDGSVFSLIMTAEPIIEAVTVLQMNAEAAIKRIATITDPATLDMIAACDSRKTVKKAATERMAFRHAFVEKEVGE